MGIQDKIKELEDELGRTQKNKATEYHIGIIKSKVAKLRRELGVVDDRIPPIVERDALRQKLGAEAVRVAPDPIDRELLAHARRPARE